MSDQLKVQRVTRLLNDDNRSVSSESVRALSEHIPYLRNFLRDLWMALSDTENGGPTDA